MSRPVGEAPAGPLSFGQAVGRAGWFAAAGILAALNAQADQIIHALTDKTLSTALIELGGISAIIWFAMFAALKIGLEDETNGLSRRDLAVLAIVGLLSFLPLFFAAKIGLFLAGSVAYVLSFNPPTKVFQRIVERQRPNEDWTISLFDQAGVLEHLGELAEPVE